eukprot:TRINITY_DN10144_c0_g3_i1.p2 TRINITY_DN10144_c0_g3~~TRINITY_DN10144_c0_g3_i1.p2  ORF type:complete len:107 (-),score=8.00 TRINITY_DN10144_c0_g3_i1:86-406(-)
MILVSHRLCSCRSSMGSYPLLWNMCMCACKDIHNIPTSALFVDMQGPLVFTVFRVPASNSHVSIDRNVYIRRWTPDPPCAHQLKIFAAQNAHQLKILAAQNDHHYQ